MKRQIHRARGPEPASPVTDSTSSAWRWKALGETCAKMLGGTLLGALGVSTLFSVVDIVTGKFTLPGFGRLLLLWGGVAIVVTVFNALLMLVVEALSWR